MGRLKVAWFNGWSSELDRALADLPEMECCPRGLYAEMMRAGGGTVKKTALVTENGAPVAVAGLRRLSRFSWTPAAQWLLPGHAFPAKPGYEITALQALNTSLRVGWWRVRDVLPRDSNIREVEVLPIYRLPLDCDREAFWRRTGYLNTIRRARSRCGAFEVRVDDPGAIEWVVSKWAEQWKIPADQTRDRLLIASELQRAGRHHTVSIYDGDKRIAAASQFIHRNELVAGVIHSMPEYRAAMLGVYLLDKTFDVAADLGVEAYDLGGGQDYKRKWAPEGGTRTSFILAPPWVWRMQQGIKAVRGWKSASSIRAGKPLAEME